VSEQKKVDILVLDVQVTEHPDKKGNLYKKAEISYKDLAFNKVQSRTIVSFGKTSKAFLSIVSNPKGKYTVEMEKEGEYWTWLSATPSDGKTVDTAQVRQGDSSPQPQPASRFQEDKDKVQKYIVRQSSLKAAIDYSVLKGDKKVTVDDVVQLAATFESYVFDEYVPAEFVKTTGKTLPAIEIDEDDIKF
jgi:hypothetical protein